MGVGAQCHLVVGLQLRPGLSLSSLKRAKGYQPTSLCTCGHQAQARIYSKKVALLLEGTKEEPSPSLLCAGSCLSGQLL